MIILWREERDCPSFTASRPINPQPVGFKVTLTDAQQQLIRTALSGSTAHTDLTDEQWRAINELCADRGGGREPEKFLIAFKEAITDAANDQRIPSGPDRNFILSRLITVFIHRLYASDDDGVPAGSNGAARDIGELARVNSRHARSNGAHARSNGDHGRNNGDHPQSNGDHAQGNGDHARDERMNDDAISA